MFEVSGYAPDMEVDPIDNLVADAIRELDAWDEAGFKRARAPPRAGPPRAGHFVFGDLAPAQGIAAVVSEPDVLHVGRRESSSTIAVGPDVGRSRTSRPEQ